MLNLLNKTSFTAASFAIAMVAALACGRRGEEPLGETSTTSAAVRAQASCDSSRDVGSCSEYSSTSASFGVERSLCRGEFATKVCPTSNRIGACELGDSEVKRYYAGSFTAESARRDCEQNARAKWVATK